MKRYVIGRDLLRQRALALAEIPQEQRRVLEAQDYLFFVLGSRSYAFPTAHVLGVTPVEVADITYLPGAAAWILGVCNVRGRIVPVVELAQLLQTERTSQEHLRLILVDAGSSNLAFLCDAIEGVRSLSSDDLQDIPNSWPEEQRQHLQAVTASGQPILRFHSILATPGLITEDEREEEDA